MKERILTKRDGILISQIVTRALRLAEDAGVEGYTRVNLVLGIGTAHRLVPLDLDMLLEADDSNFAHDVFGIMRHLNPKTRQLEDCFVPRMARINHGKILSSA